MINQRTGSGKRANNPADSHFMPGEPKKFEVLPWRWIVERTFAWLGRYRRLSKDYEGSSESSESWIYIAMTHLMLRRLEPA
jgi:transposase